MAAIPFRLILWLFFGYSDLLDGPDVWHGPHESNVCANCSVFERNDDQNCVASAVFHAVPSADACMGHGISRAH